MTMRDDDPADRRALMARIDAACDHFELAWQSGGRPRAEDYLGGVPDLGRAELLRHLLALDVVYHHRLGETPTQDDYRPRFPLDDRLIAEVLAVEARRSPTDGGSAGPSSTLAEPREGSTGLPGRRPGGLASVPGSEVLRELLASNGVDATRTYPPLPGYEILGELGRGGAGIVYLAREVRLNRPCALKMIDPGGRLDDESIARFFAEAETVARLRHPHIVQVYHLGEHEGRPYLELEYAEGGSLAQRLDGTPWPPQEAARLIEVLAGAIGEVHRLGVIHRDLKPGNILLTADGTPKIADFGLAKSLASSSTLTTSGAILGTPSYMAPEQAGGLRGAIGSAADVYALGAILYELLTGRPPFKGATVLETLDQVKGSEPVPPSRLVPRLPRDLETICLKCLEKEPARRYVSASELAEDLRRFQAGEPIVARPIWAWERAVRWARHRPVAAAWLRRWCCCWPGRSARGRGPTGGSIGHWARRSRPGGGPTRPAPRRSPSRTRPRSARSTRCGWAAPLAGAIGRCANSHAWHRSRRRNGTSSSCGPKRPRASVSWTSAWSPGSSRPTGSW
jgi:hypothetical protein